MPEYATVAALSLLCAVISAKWAMELGDGQVGQIISGLGGLFLGPLVPLFLYIRLLRAKLGKPVTSP